MSDTYAPGATVFLTATVDNAEFQALANVAGSWSASAGTVVQDAVNPDLATLTGLPLGDFTATFTTTEGAVAGSYTATVMDSVPSSVTVTGSATPPAPAA